MTIFCPLFKDTKFVQKCIQDLEKNEPTLTSLILPSKILNDKDIAKFSKALETNTYLTILDLTMNHFLTDNSVFSLSKALVVNKSLKILKLSCLKKLTNNSCKFMATALETNNTIEEIYFEDKSKIDDKGCEIFIDFFNKKVSSKSRLRMVKFDNNPSISQATLLKLRKAMINHAINKIIEDDPSVHFIDLSSLGIYDEDLTNISKSLLTNHHITKISLANNNISDFGFEWLIKTVLLCDSLEIIDLCNNKITNKNIESLINIFIDEPRLIREIRLDQNNITEMNLIRLQKAIIHSSFITRLRDNNPSLKNFSMINMPIDDHDIKIFAKLLETNTFLESLDLSQNNNITDVGCQELINLYRSNKNNTLQEIKLDNNPFISEENYNTLKRLMAKVIVKRIAHNDMTLLSANLSSKLLEDCDIKLLVKALEKNHYLKILNLDQNNISCSGAKTLADFCLNKSEKCCLRQIFLNGNYIEQENIVNLNKILLKNLISRISDNKECLTSIDFSNLKLFDYDLIEIARALEQNTYLLRINLDGNNLTSIGCQIFTNLFLKGKNTTIEEISLNNNKNISDSFIKKLSVLLLKNIRSKPKINSTPANMSLLSNDELSVLSLLPNEELSKIDEIINQEPCFLSDRSLCTLTEIIEDKQAKSILNLENTTSFSLNVFNPQISDSRGFQNYSFSPSTSVATSGTSTPTLSHSNSFSSVYSSDLVPPYILIYYDTFEENTLNSTITFKGTYYFKSRNKKSREVFLKLSKDNKEALRKERDVLMEFKQNNVPSVIEYIDYFDSDDIHENNPCKLYVEEFSFSSRSSSFSSSTTSSSIFDLSPYDILVIEQGDINFKQYQREIRRLNNNYIKYLSWIRPQLYYLADSLSSLHANGFVWMDCKPENFVRVTNSIVQTFKAIDFETSVCLGEYDSILLICEREKLRITPRYCAPELLLNLSDKQNSNNIEFKVTKSYDVFSFGLLLFECFNYNNNLRTLWQELGIETVDDGASIINFVRQGHLTDAAIEEVLLRRFPPNITNLNISIISLLKRALQIDPNKRSSMLELSASSLLSGSATTENIGKHLSVINENISNQLKDVRSDILEIDNKVEQLSTQVLENLNEFKIELTASLTQISANQFKELEKFISNHFLDLIRVQKRDFNNLGKDLMNMKRFLLDSSLIEGNDGTIDIENYNNLLNITSSESSPDEFDTYILNLVKLSSNVESNEIKEMNSKLDELIKIINKLDSKVDEIKENETKILSLLNVIEKNTFKLDVPITFIAIPLESSKSSSFKFINYFNDFLWDNYLILFLCPIRKIPVRCGPDGKGFLIKKMKTNLKNFINYVKLGYSLLKVGTSLIGFSSLINSLEELFKNEKMYLNYFNQFYNFLSKDIVDLKQENISEVTTEIHNDLEKQEELVTFVKEVFKSTNCSESGLVLTQIKNQGSIWISPEAKKQFEVEN